CEALHVSPPYTNAAAGPLGAQGVALSIPDAGVLVVGAKPADDGEGAIVKLLDVAGAARGAPVGPAAFEFREARRTNRVALNGEALVPGIVGYEDTVIPQLVNAILSRHNFILLGLRGQAKSRILRQLVTLLDEEVPILAGSEVNDSPFAPISKYGRELVTERGDQAPVAWLPRDARFVEKLATPDGTLADTLRDVDPTKAARGGHLLSDALT